MTMKIMGIDPGLKATGYALIEETNRQPRLMEAGTINPKATAAFEQKLMIVYKQLDALLEQYRPDVLVLEKLYAHGRHPMTSSIMGHVRGVICLLCAQKNISLSEQGVKRIRKALTGNGNATKLQTRKFIAYQLHVRAENFTLDASDACALALGYMHLNRNA